MKIKAGTRTSRLALWQAERIASLIESTHADEVEVEIVGMSTLGDEIQDRSLPEIGGKGLFTERLERALLAEEIDLAVHSLKDLPTRLPDGLRFGGSPERGDPTDAFVSTRWDSVEAMPRGATVATGSRRRRAQMRARRPDVEFVDLRGNIGTRLDKLDEHGWDGLIMATAALRRLNMEETITEALDPTLHVPAVSQGALGLEVAEDHADIDAILDPILDDTVTLACRAERAFLRTLEGGCTVPLGGHCRREGDTWAFYGWVGEIGGDRVLSDRRTTKEPVETALEMAHAFIDAGAREMLTEPDDFDG
jgi:hydroxymethylbilane synthase